MLTLIAVALFFASEVIYSQSDCANCTNWIIFYYSFHYISIAIVCADQTLTNEIKWIRWLFLVFGLLSLSYVIIELSFLNVPYERYILGIQNRIVTNLTVVIITFIAGILTYLLWHKHLRAFYRRLLDRL